MQPLKQLAKQQKNHSAAAKALGLSPQQLTRQIERGAIADESGQVWIPSTNKVNLPTETEK